jgi:hypothetical protein
MISRITILNLDQCNFGRHPPPQQQYGCENHMMTKVGSSSTQVTPSSFMCLDGLIIKNEKSRRSHENPNSIPKL